MLEKFKHIKHAEVEKLAALKRNGSFPAPFNGQRPAFSANLKSNGPAIIAEIKKASPSRGTIRPDTKVAELAAAYARNGAAAISVLTEEYFFKGHLKDLNAACQANRPLLRKDFILDRIQLEHTAAYPASAVLLIVCFLNNDQKLKELVLQSRLFGLEPVVEIFSKDELHAARRAGADIIQVNNRDLNTLNMDLNNSHSLISEKTDGETWICASGLSTREQCLEMRALGFDACLLGTCIMLADNPGQKLAELTGTAK